MNYEQKYLKYKNKYLTLKKQIGGWKCLNCNTVNEESLTVCKSCAKKHSVGAPSGSVPSASGSSAAASSAEASSGGPPPATPVQECSYCKKPAETRCGNCSTTYYCNQSCQRAHWPIHKIECNKIKERNAGIAALGQSMRRSIPENKGKFYNILMTTRVRYIYIKNGGTDPEIIEQFNKAIQDRKNDVFSNTDLITPILTKYAAPSSREDYRQMTQYIREFDEGRRTFNDPIEFTF